jgi:hypothetical protein
MRSTALTALGLAQISAETPGTYFVTRLLSSSDQAPRLFHGNLQILAKPLEQHSLANMSVTRREMPWPTCKQTRLHHLQSRSSAQLSD